MVVRIFLVLFGVLLAATAQAQDKPRYGGELIFLVPSELPSYDGHREGTFGVVHPLAPHYNTLLRIDPFDKTGTRPVPDLAESWTISPDRLVYTFKLRQGVKFHDGSVMTSRDVKASYDKIVFPPTGVISMRKGSYGAIETIEAPDPQTVRFRLKWPEASFLIALSSPYNWIYKADILAKDMRWYETNVMGTGPFKFVEHVKGSHWVGKKNPDYWDKGKPYLDGYRALFITSSSAQVAAIRGERAHIQFRGFSPADRDAIVSALGVEEQRVNVIADFVAPDEVPDTLKDAFRVEAKIVTWEQDNVLKVPNSALFRQGEGWAVFLVRDGRAVLHPVEIGRRSSLEAQVIKGLEEGDEVVAHPSDKIRDGVSIELRE